MITRITGTIVERGPELVVLEAGGIGYALRVPATLAVGLRDGEVVTLHTHFHVREDAQELYGFSDRASLLFFEKLIGISGVGPKTAIHIMALGTVAEIKTAVAREDVAFLTSVSGVGRKIAERIVMELREAFQKEIGVTFQGATPGMQEVAEALMSLGYKTTEIQKVLTQLRQGGTLGSTEELLRQALQRIQQV
ncbi:MAG: Holliday junction branch migration protein RuvA [Patescibacteria group bacterium]